MIRHPGLGPSGDRKSAGRLESRGAVSPAPPPTAAPMTRLSLLALTLLAPAASAIGDGVVQFSGVSHFGWHDRSPAVPVRNEAFTVRFQALEGDLTAARVRQYVTGTPTRTFEAQVVGQRGPYAVWEAQLDGRDATEVLYDIVVEDGADVDYIGVGGHGESAPQGGPFELDFDTWAHAPRGATPTSQGVVYRVWAPTAPQCNVRGSFNGWSLANPMTRVDEDFVAHVTISGEGDEYKFYFPATATWKGDPNARRMVVNDNGVVYDPEGYDWQTDDFTLPARESMVHYQLHVGSFAGKNDPAGFAPSPSRFVDVENRIAHLTGLGVNVVYLNPLDEWPGTFSGGYDPISYTAIESAYGTPNDLKRLVDSLHAAGIAVILDVVPNHVSFSGNFLFGYQGSVAASDNIYFDTPPVDTPWGSQLDFDRAPVREYVLEAITQKLEEYRFDGLRVDALSAMLYGPQEFYGREILKDLNARSDVRWSQKLIVAEEYSDDPWITRSLALGGLGFESQYHNGFKTPLRNAVLGASSGNVDVSAVAGAMTRSGELSGTRVFNYFELHDDVWGLSGGERAVKTIDTSFPHDDVFATGLTKLGHGLNLLAKGIPALVMGSEWLEDQEWQVQKIDWAHTILYGGVIDYYRALIGLRTGVPELFANSTARTIHLNDANDVFAIERSLSGGGAWLVVANFSDTSWSAPFEYRVGAPRAGTWKVVVNSDAVEYRGEGFGELGLVETDAIPYDGQAQSLAVAIPPRGLLVLQHEPELLAADVDAVSLTSGGSIELSVDVTVEHAGDIYWVLGSATGTSPGIPVAPGVVLPLLPDAYFTASLVGANQAPFSANFGLLDATGRGQAVVTLLGGLPQSLAGTALHHCAAIVDPLTQGVERVTAPVSTDLTP